MPKSLISCINWVPRGAPKRIPDKYEPNPEYENIEYDEYNSIISKDSNEEDAIMNDSNTKETPENDIDLAKFNLDTYDDEPDIIDRILGGPLDPMELDDAIEEDDDITEDIIRPIDSCILVGITDTINSNIEVYLYDERKSNLYVHHDFNLEEYPTCVQWFNTHPKLKDKDDTNNNVGSYAAIGTFLPGIEIWNLDIISPIGPICTLGGYQDTDETVNKKTNVINKKKRTKVHKTLKEGSHSEAITCLFWETTTPNRLISGSEDTYIKLWDITTQQCYQNIQYHQSRITGFDQNPTASNILISASNDKIVYLSDLRVSSDIETTLKIQLKEETECIKWDIQRPYLFTVTDQSGNILFYDIRYKDKDNKPLWDINAHKDIVTSISYNTVVPLLATTSIDGHVKIWDTSKDIEPTCLANRDMHVGKLFAIEFDKSSPFILATGGDKGCLAIWDTMENININDMYGSKAEQLRLGSQDLPQEYIEMQRKGIQSKGIGPSTETNENSDKDTDTDDDADYRNYEEKNRWLSKKNNITDDI